MDSQESTTKQEIILWLDGEDLGLLRGLLESAIQGAEVKAVWMEGVGATSDRAERLRGIAEQLDVLRELSPRGTPRGEGGGGRSRKLTKPGI